MTSSSKTESGTDRVKMLEVAFKMLYGAVHRDDSDFVRNPLLKEGLFINVAEVTEELGVVLRGMGYSDEEVEAMEREAVQTDYCERVIKKCERG